MDFGRAYAAELWLVATNPARKKNLDRDYTEVLEKLMKEPEGAISLQVFGCLFHGFVIILREKLLRALRIAESTIQRVLRKGQEEKKRQKLTSNAKGKKVDVLEIKMMRCNIVLNIEILYHYELRFVAFKSNIRHKYVSCL